MTSAQRMRMERSISHLIGLELWLIGELDLTEQELLHLFSSLQARMAVVQAIAWRSDEEPSEGAAGSAVEADSNERSPYG